MKNESDYCFQTLLFISKMASEGKRRVPEKMGITDEQLSVIHTLNTQDMHEMALMAHVNFLSVAFDHSALSVALTVMEEKKSRRQKIHELLLEGASYPVMKHLYGMTTTDISSCRKMLSLTRNEGRPSTPSVEDQTELWQYITPDDLDDDDQLADKLLLAARETGIKINAIWMVLNQWKKEGLNKEGCDGMKIGQEFPV